MHKLKNSFSEILICRLCNSKNIQKFIDFGSTPLGNNLQEKKEMSQNVESYDLKVMRCNDCQHFQLSVSILPELLYATNYTYLSGIGSSFVEHIKKYVSWVLDKTCLKTSGVIVDIGSNDGTCLKFFKKKDFLSVVLIQLKSLLKLLTQTIFLQLITSLILTLLETF